MLNSPPLAGFVPAKLGTHVSKRSQYTMYTDAPTHMNTELACDQKYHTSEISMIF